MRALGLYFGKNARFFHFFHSFFSDFPEADPSKYRKTAVNMLFVALYAAVLALTFVLTGCVRRFTLRKNILDIPGARSSHSVPTPRGGGLGFVVTVTVFCLFLPALSSPALPLALALFGGGGAVALVGWMDDKYGQPILTRFAVHILAAVWCAGWLGAGYWGLAGFVFFTLAGVWLINAYNFMDGIDGLAAGQAVTAGVAGGLVMWGTESGIVALAVGVAVLGFLPYNWPPAKIFMGDVGSGFLGLVFAALWVCGTQVPGGFFVWPILLGVFLVDATFTLLWRMARREKWYASHRSHIYQTATDRWGHAPVTKTILAINLLWLTPCAVVCRLAPEWSLAIAAIAFLPLTVLYWWIRLQYRNTVSDSGNPCIDSGNPLRDSGNP